MILLSRSRSCRKDCIIPRPGTHRSSERTTPLKPKYVHRPKRKHHTVRAKFALSTTDEYFQVPDYGETYPFSVRGQTILLDSCSLAVALAELPEQTQEEIFLYYFQHLTQKEIGEQSGWTRSTIGRHIQLA
ncbi:MAG: sigma factor-like helix-turn-helix DNA-binding protein, partial [Candidatus Faecousia sp.]|nr:sigma factor-like helix-turn-helix DNA-binding protein [Candidatus Faecousia sp.]